MLDADMKIINQRINAMLIDSQARQISAKTVILVDDEEHIRMICAAVLKKAGYNVIEAKNGREAVDKAHHTDGTICLLLTDVRMPEMNGKEAADIIAQQMPGINILFMSGFTSEISIERGSNFLPKPFTPSILRAKVDSILGEQSEN